MSQNIYDIKINSIDGKALDLSEFKGKKLLIVNVASECGYTPQYAQLQELYSKYSDKLTILGCPCNDFGGQEPGSGEEIMGFCRKNYGVTFPLTEKISITSDPHPLFAWLTKKELNMHSDNEVKWNFSKFLISDEGKLIQAYPSGVEPLDEKIISLLN